MPTADGGGYAYYGPTGRTFWLRPEQYTHALRLAVQSTAAAQDPLIAVVTEGQAAETNLSELTLPCPSAAGSRIAMLLVVTAGAIGWLATVVTGWRALHDFLDPSAKLLWVLPAALGTTLLHEWGHALALRSVGGKAGRTLVRRGFPLLVTEVGPVRLLSSGKRLWVVGAGLLVEASLLGMSAAAYSVGVLRGAATGIIVFEALSLLLSLLPWRGSDLFRLLHFDEV